MYTQLVDSQKYRRLSRDSTCLDGHTGAFARIHHICYSAYGSLRTTQCVQFGEEKKKRKYQTLRMCGSKRICYTRQTCCDMANGDAPHVYIYIQYAVCYFNPNAI